MGVPPHRILHMYRGVVQVKTVELASTFICRLLTHSSF